MGSQNNKAGNNGLRDNGEGMNQSLRHGTAVGLVGRKVTSNQLLLLQLVITGNPTKEIASETLKLITHTIAERKETQGRHDD